MKLKWPLRAAAGVVLAGATLVSGVLVASSAGWLRPRWLMTRLRPAIGPTQPAGLANNPAGKAMAKTAGSVKGTSMPASPVGPLFFTAIPAAEAGVDFRQVSGNSPQKHFPAANGTGVAMLDYDGDGWQDLYFVTSVPFPLDPNRTEPHNKLYRNRHDGSFQPVTAPSGTGHCGFGQGVTAADFDNDGFPDLYLTCYGPNVLYRNNGDGTFSDVSRSSGAGDRRWGTSCAALDYDNDGNLDLYVANYGQWSPDNNPFCGDKKRGIRNFCSPRTVTPELHALWHNGGDWTFEDRLSALGLTRTDGRGQGVVSADLNGDGLIDLYVANDMCPNFLFLNRGEGKMEDFSEFSGASRSAEGEERAGMGVDAADVTGDGRPELFVTNFYGEPNSLFRNEGNGYFWEITASAGFRASGIPMVKWGTRLADLDNDSWPDVFVASGHVDDNLMELGNPDAPHEEPALLWRNVGQGRFKLVSSTGGSYFQVPHVGRGAAFGDWDNDGDLDIVVNHVDNVPALLRNDSPATSGRPPGGQIAAAATEQPGAGGTALSGQSTRPPADPPKHTTPVQLSAQEPGRVNHWIRLVLRGRTSNRDAIGTLVRVQLGDRELVRQLKGGTSYSSAHDPRLLVGVGSTETVERVEIHWPSGAKSVLENVAVDQEYNLAEPL